MPTAQLDSEVIQERLQRLVELRHKCRTDLMFLMKEILGYKDVDPKVHGPIIDALPTFHGGKDTILSNGTIQYVPTIPLWELRGKRKRLILYPRGHLKTSIISQAGVIQWILNYPNIRILVTTATADLAQTILSEIKSHFQFNESFRFLFSDYCPQKSVKDWGNAESFTVPNRKKASGREPTLSTSSVGKTIAGKHYEVLACSDMVDKENVRTPGGIREVIEHFNYMDPLLERHEVQKDSGLPNHGWITVEGTSYAFADLYSDILKHNGVRITEFREGIETRETEDWTILHGDAEIDQTKKLTIWPARFPWDELKKMERSMGPYLYSSQMRNRPMSDEGGLAQENQISWFTTGEIRPVREVLRIHSTVDVAGMEADSRGDYTVLTTAGFDRDGRCYVLDIRRGHFTPTEVIDHIFDIHRIYRPIDIKIEKDAHARVLGHFLQREMAKRQIFPTIVELKRDTRTSKVQRIKGLQPWFAAKIIRFYEGLVSKTDLVREIVEFPSSAHDDILDTLADQMQNREGGVNSDVLPNAEDTPESAPFRGRKVLAFDNSRVASGLTWMPMAEDFDHAEDQTYHRMTGL